MHCPLREEVGVGGEYGGDKRLQLELGFVSTFKGFKKKEGNNDSGN